MAPVDKEHLEGISKVIFYFSIKFCSIYLMNLVLLFNKI